jgi:hypothetical protein
MLFNEGFVLDDSSPAGKIMARLVREGYADGGGSRAGQAKFLEIEHCTRA